MMKQIVLIAALVAILPISASAYPLNGRVMLDHLNIYFLNDPEITPAMLDARVTEGYVTSFFETLLYERRICLSNQRSSGVDILLTTRQYLDKNPESHDMAPQKVLRLIADEYYSCQGSTSNPAEDLELTNIDSKGANLDIDYKSKKVMQIKCSVYDRDGDLITWERIMVGRQQQGKGSFIIPIRGFKLWEHVECVLPDGQSASFSRPKG